MIDERFVASLAKTALLTPAEKVSRVMLVFTLTCWWSSGHQIIARIAEQMLTRQQLSYLSSIFAEWPDESGSIMDISTWQDRIKDDAEIRTMSAWHFVDLPIIDPKFVPTSIRTFYNVTSAIHDSFETLMNPSTTSRWAISFSLRNLIHFVGDVHQPLHASGFFSADYPTGDAGGNHFKVSCAHGAACANMHALWDSGLLKYQFDHFSHFLDEFESNVSYIT
jgi:hypothetical protein